MKEILLHSIIIESPDITKAKAQALEYACQILNTKTPENHPDCWIISPEGKSQTIKIEFIRDIIEQAQKSTNTAAKKVFIINQADRLNLNAANALLKTLEEPTNDTIFILTTTSKNLLLPTIVSRCAVYHIDAQSTAFPPKISDWIERLINFLETHWKQPITPFQIEVFCNDIAEILKSSEENTSEPVSKFLILEKIAQTITSDLIGKVPTEQLSLFVDIVNEAKKIIEFNGSFSQAIEFILLRFYL